MTRTLEDVLHGVTGVWEGTYAHHNPDGTLIEKYGSRQETRLIGEEWYERIIYTREGKEPEILDFRAKVRGNDMLFEDDDFIGRTHIVDEKTLMFPYHWKKNPDRTILETIHNLTGDYRTRVWQTFEHGAIVKLTLIEERRIPKDSPAARITEWF